MPILTTLVGKENMEMKMSLMERKLHNGDVIFTDSYWGDFKFYLWNNHIFFAIFCSHPENPNNKGARFLAFLSSNIFAMFLSSIAALEKDPTTFFILEYVVFMIIQTIFDMNALYISSCSCFHSDGTPVSRGNQSARTGLGT